MRNLITVCFIDAGTKPLLGTRAANVTNRPVANVAATSWRMLYSDKTQCAMGKGRSKGMLPKTVQTGLPGWKLYRLLWDQKEKMMIILSGCRPQADVTKHKMSESIYENARSDQGRHIFVVITQGIFNTSIAVVTNEKSCVRRNGGVLVFKDCKMAGSQIASAFDTWFGVGNLEICKWRKKETQDPSWTLVELYFTSCSSGSVVSANDTSAMARSARLATWRAPLACLESISKKILAAYTLIWGIKQLIAPVIPTFPAFPASVRWCARWLSNPPITSGLYQRGAHSKEYIIKFRSLISVTPNNWWSSCADHLKLLSSIFNPFQWADFAASFRQIQCYSNSRRWRCSHKYHGSPLTSCWAIFLSDDGCWQAARQYRSDCTWIPCGQSDLPSFFQQLPAHFLTIQWIELGNSFDLFDLEIIIRNCKSIMKLTRG